MNLYNIFENIILEETAKAKLLKENVSDGQVMDAIKGKYNVHILYDDYPNETPSVAPSKRYIQVYNLATTKAGNAAIRAFQLGGPSKTTTEGAWKIFRLDRIRGWNPTKVRWKRPVSDFSAAIPTYNKDGDRSMNSITHKAEFGTYDKYVAPSGTRPLTPQEKPKVQPKLNNKPQSSYVAAGDPKPAIAEPKKPVDTSSTTKSEPQKKKENGITNTTTRRPHEIERDIR